MTTESWTRRLRFFVAVALWTPLLVGAAMVLGERAFAYVEAFQRNALPALILLALGGKR